jgi:lipopolysaccharide/colanic/teichoic acid biosynthesis glycosyltransferase
MYVYRQSLYTAVQLIVDVFSFWPIWMCASYFRIALDPFMKIRVSAATAPRWVAPMALILLLWLVLSFRFRLYAVPEHVRTWTILRWTATNTIALCAAAVVATFCSRQFGQDASRMFVVCLAPATFIVFAATRGIVLAAMTVGQRRWPPPRIALIGDLAAAKRFIERVQSQIRFAIRGLVVPEGTAVAGLGQPLLVLGTTGQVAELFNRERIDRVIMLQGSIPDSEWELCNRVAWRMGLPVSCALNLDTEIDATPVSWRSPPKLELRNQFGLQVVDMQSGHSSREDFLKRLFDFVMSSVLLVLLAPLLLLIAIAVKFTSKGPVFEKAPRVGKGGRHFPCFKFRTTFEDLNQPPPEDFVGGSGILNTDDTQHTTPLGTTLRFYSLDELPQLLNILRNEMSLVGPRPLPANAFGPDGMSQEHYAWSETRARVHPGMTGLWQISGRNLLSFPDMIRLDIEYIENRSFAYDLNIILETPVAMLRGSGAPLRIRSSRL